MHPILLPELSKFSLRQELSKFSLRQEEMRKGSRPVAHIQDKGTSAANYRTKLVTPLLGTGSKSAAQQQQQQQQQQQKLETKEKGTMVVDVIKGMVIDDNSKYEIL